MINITNFREGAVLNAKHGSETADSLTVTIEGICSYGTPVAVNGRPARMDGLSFSAEAVLKDMVNTIEVKTVTSYGEFIQKIHLVWDKRSFRRCSFYIDDHSFLFTELAGQRPSRAFDHFYLKELKRLNELYGLKVTLNTFYRNDHKHFELKDMPDIWKKEFEDNSHWLKFSLHSYSEFPDRPYADASRKKFLEDYRLLQNEITRFAGENAFIVPQVLHWNNVSSGVADELIKLGCRCYSESLRPRMMATPPYEELTELERQTEFRSEIYVPPTEAMARHYGFAEEIDYLEKHGVLYDHGLGVFFNHDWLVCNLLELQDIPRLFQQVKARADMYNCDVFSACGHEQYSFPDYFNYQPDHFRKLETTIKLMVEEANCQPVFFQHGLLGNTVWGD